MVLVPCVLLYVRLSFDVMNAPENLLLHEHYVAGPC